MAKNRKSGDGLIRRIGNFNIYQRIDRHGNWMIVENLIKSWQVRYRDDNEMYSLLMFVLSFKDEIVDSYLERFIVGGYFQTNHLHDWLCMTNGGEKDGNGDVNYLPFFTAYWKLIDDEAKREAGYWEKAGKDEDEKALEEAVLSENLIEEMKNIRIDEDGTVHER